MRLTMFSRCTKLFHQSHVRHMSFRSFGKSSMWTEGDYIEKLAVVGGSIGGVCGLGYGVHSIDEDGMEAVPYIVPYTITGAGIGMAGAIMWPITIFSISAYIVTQRS